MHYLYGVHISESGSETNSATCPFNVFIFYAQSTYCTSIELKYYLTCKSLSHTVSSSIALLRQALAAKYLRCDSVLLQPNPNPFWG